jgi:prolyl oligopeptidase
VLRAARKSGYSPRVITQSSSLTQLSAWLSISTLSLLAACGGDPEPPPLLGPPVTPTVAPSVAVAPAPSSSGPRNGFAKTTKREATVDSLHGVRVADPYRWLEDGKSPETSAWVLAQDAAARKELTALPERAALAARLKELYYVDALGAPSHRGNRYFFSRKRATDEKSILYVRDGKNGTERVLLNPNDWSTDGSTSLGQTASSHDGRYMAYTVKTNNSDEATLYVLDVQSGQKLEQDVIPGAKYASASWTPKGDGFYYVWIPSDPSVKPTDRPGFAEVRFHRLKTDPKTDVVVREKTGDPTTFLHGWISWDGQFLFQELSHGWASSEVFFKDLREKSPVWVPLAPGKKAHYDVDAYRGKLYITTDEGAPRNRVFRVDPKKPQRDQWQEIVAEPKDESLKSASVHGGKLVLSYLKNATGRLEYRDLDGTNPKPVTLPGIGSVSGVSGLPDDDAGYFSYTSYTEPSSTFEVSAKTQSTKPYASVKVPFDPAPFTTTQVFFPSKDGTRVSMFIVHRKDLPKNAKSRAFLYGYGGFEAAETPAFNATIVPWLERGGIYAVVNLRGGSEYGEEWHQGGMLLKKQNTFDDFIAAGEYLVREGYTESTKLAIAGASNGGLLVGAAMTQRPDLFSAVLCGVPLLDMVRYHMFGSGKTWIAEYGSADNLEQFNAIYAYSPYHHVRDNVKYPALLMLGADSDDRVDPLHARKFVAEVQAKSAGGPTWLRVEKNSGHGGADLRKAEVEKNADRLAFALKFTGQ